MSTNTQHTKHVPAKTYIGVFVALAIVTAIEVAITSVITDKTVVVIVLLALAAAKALLVMMFFMHLKYDTKTYSLFLLFPLFMAILLAVIVMIAAAGI
ncbi:MAG: cytochrome C oxidase subunit IV family protein [Thermoflexales bacterium]|nr:cytochrome C oxidase subunit IV family protein [Thermoflexales bacterium]